MSWQCTSWALREAPAPTSTARLVLIALADRCQPDGRSAWPTIDTLMMEAHTSESSVKRALKALEESGCIRRGNQSLAQWDENGNWVPEQYRSTVWECCMDVTLEHVSYKPGRQARAEREQRKVAQTAPTPRRRNRGVKMTPLENGGNKPKPRGVKMTPPKQGDNLGGVTSDTSRGFTSDTPIRETNDDKQITLLPPTVASPRSGESRAARKDAEPTPQTDTVPQEPGTLRTAGDGEPWRDPEAEGPSTATPQTRAARLLDRLEAQRKAMGLTPRNRTVRDLRAVAGLVERLDRDGADTDALMGRVLDHALETPWQAKRVDTGRRFARLFDELHDDLTIDLQATGGLFARREPDVRREPRRPAPEREPARLAALALVRRRREDPTLDKDLGDGRIDARTVMERLTTGFEAEDGEPAQDTLDRLMREAVDAGRAVAAERRERERQAELELERWRRSHGGSCFAGNWNDEDAA